MKKLLLFLLLNLTLQADYFTLTMNDRNLKMCRDMGRVFNKLTKEKTLKNFKEFNSIKWDKKFDIYNGKYMSEPEDLQYAIFDINNDGKDEIIRMNNTLENHGYDAYEKIGFRAANDLTYYRLSFKEQISNGKTVGNEKIIENLLGSIDIAYHLKKYPPYKISINPYFSDPEPSSYYNAIYRPYVRVMIYKKKYYVVMFANAQNKLYKTPQIVILEFSKDNEIADLCYYIKSWQEN